MPSTKNENLSSTNLPGILKACLKSRVLKAFFLAARPKTWIASISPVLMGASLAPWAKVDGRILLLTLGFALCVQIGTNFANDVFDFLKGADQERIGPKRAVQEGWISVSGMFAATYFVLGLALVIATPLIYRAGWWSLPLALVCILCAIGYTGGPKPFAYLGISEIFIAIFFGPVAGMGSYFLQTHQTSLESFIVSLIPAFFSCALLTVNNLRDEESDRKANKKTLVVRFGCSFGRFEYCSMLWCALLSPLVLILFTSFSLSLLSLCLLFIPGIYFTQGICRTSCFNEYLPKTSLLFSLYTLIFCYLQWMY